MRVPKDIASPPGGRHTGYALVQGQRVVFYKECRLHCVPLSEKAEKRGYEIVANLFYQENLSDLKPELY